MMMTYLMIACPTARRQYLRSGLSHDSLVVCIKSYSRSSKLRRKPLVHINYACRETANLPISRVVALRVMVETASMTTARTVRTNTHLGKVRFLESTKIVRVAQDIRLM